MDEDQWKKLISNLKKEKQEKMNFLLFHAYVKMLETHSTKYK